MANFFPFLDFGPFSILCQRNQIGRKRLKIDPKTTEIRHQLDSEEGLGRASVGLAGGGFCGWVVKSQHLEVPEMLGHRPFCDPYFCPKLRFFPSFIAKMDQKKGGVNLLSLFWGHVFGCPKHGGGNGDGPRIPYKTRHFSNFLAYDSLVVKTCTFSNKSGISPLFIPKVTTQGKC